MENSKYSSIFGGFPKQATIIFSLWIVYMVGCATVRGLLVFYATDKLGMTENASYLLYAAYGAINFATCFAGGWLGTHYFGFRFASPFGLFMYGMGIAMISLGHSNTINIGLSLMAVGSGLFSPNTNSLLNRILKKGDSRRNSAFTISYTSMNIGALTGYCFSGFVKKILGYENTFFFAAVITLSGLLFFTAYHKSFVKDELIDGKSRFLGLVFVVLLIFCVTFLTAHSKLCDYLIAFIGVITIVGLNVIGLHHWIKFRDTSWLKFAGLGFVSIFFWSLYQLKASFLNFYVKDFVNRIAFGTVIPTTFFQALNPIFMIFIGSFLSILWLKLEAKNIHIKVVDKFLLAVLYIGFSYLVLDFGSNFSINQKIGITWILLYFLFMSLGEMLIAPAGYAMVGELFTNVKIQGVLQGIWNMFCAIGYALSGIIAVKSPVLLGIHDSILTFTDDRKIFVLIGLSACIVALTIWFVCYIKFSKFINKSLIQRINSNV